jgi:hypothetical protein
MTVITARGNDSSEAMEEVIRRLGANAYILSTTVKNGMVEIRAATELEGAAPAPEAPVKVETRSGESMVERAKRFSDLLEARSDWAEPVVLRPALPPRRTPWSQVSPAARHAAFVDRLETELLAPDALPIGQLMPRTIVVGPPGAGKSLLAVRMAAAALLADRGLQPRIIAPRMANLLSDDRLRGWSRLLGITPERPLVGDLLNADEGSSPDLARPQIFDLSDVPQRAHDLVSALIRPMQSELVLALPVGLSPRRTLREVARWAALSPRVCLTFCDTAGPDRAQMTALIEAGVRLSRAAAGMGVIETLSVPARADLARWVQEEADEDQEEKTEARI